MRLRIKVKNYNRIESKGFVMIGVLFVMLFLGILLTIAYLRLEIEFDGTIGQSNSTRSLFIAEAGIERTISMLRTAPKWRAGFTNESLKDMNGNTIGYYTVVFNSETYTPPWTTLSVTSTGMLDTANPEYRRTIHAVIKTANPGEFFAFTSDKAVISNGADIQNGSLYAWDMEFRICPVYPYDLVIDQPSYYIKEYKITDPNGSTAPNVQLNTTPTKLDSPVAFPALDLDYYRELADPAKFGKGRYYSGDVTIDGITLDKSENGVIFTEGDVYIQGSIKDPVVIVSAKNIYIKGDITWAEDTEGNPIGKLGLFTKEDIYIHKDAPDNISIHAQLIAEGGVFEALGEKGSKGKLNFKGSMAIRGGKSKPYGAVDLTVYGSRTYNYDSSLLSLPPLPYVTYIAHLDSWKEG